MAFTKNQLKSIKKIISYVFMPKISTRNLRDICNQYNLHSPKSFARLSNADVSILFVLINGNVISAFMYTKSIYISKLTETNYLTTLNSLNIYGKVYTAFTHEDSVRNLSGADIDGFIEEIYSVFINASNIQNSKKVIKPSKVLLKDFIIPDPDKQKEPLTDIHLFLRSLQIPDNKRKKKIGSLDSHMNWYRNPSVEATIRTSLRRGRSTRQVTQSI